MKGDIFLWDAYAPFFLNWQLVSREFNHWGKKVMHRCLGESVDKDYTCVYKGYCEKCHDELAGPFLSFKHELECYGSYELINALIHGRPEEIERAIVSQNPIFFPAGCQGLRLDADKINWPLFVTLSHANPLATRQVIDITRKRRQLWDTADDDEGNETQKRWIKA